MNDEINPIKVTYHGIEITYLEDKNRWVYTLRGNERTVESLVKAKEAIDRPYSPKVDGPKFDHIKAFVIGYGEPEAITITSRLSENHFRYRYDVVRREGSWRARGTQTGYGDSLYPDNPENRAKMEAIKVIIDKMKALQADQLAIRGTLQTLNHYLNKRYAEYLKSTVDADIEKAE